MNSTSRSDPGLTAWMVLALLWVVAVLNYLDRLLIASMREAIEASVPMSESDFGLIISIFLWVYAAASPFAGYLADRFSRKKVIITSLVIWSLFTWLTGHAQSFVGLFLARAGMGLSEACYLPAGLALVTDYHRGRTRSLATGLHMSGNHIGTALGGIGGYIAVYYGWRHGFTLFGLFGIVYGLILVKFLRDRPAAEHAPAPGELASRAGIWRAMAELSATPGFWRLIVLNVFIGASNWIVYGWLPTYLRERFQLGVGAAGISATGYIQITIFVGVVAGGKWADRWSATNPRGRMFVPGFGYLLAAPALFVMAYADTINLALGALMLFGLGKGFYDANLMPILRAMSRERHSATGYGLLNCTSTFAGGLMTYAGGALRDQHVSLAWMFEIAALGILLSAGLLFTLRAPAADRTVAEG